MKTFFVIKNLNNNKYLSVNDVFDDWNMCKEFDSETSALKELEKLDGWFSIEKVLNKNKMEWNEELLIKFALFHAKRMNGANQSDNDFYAKQSLQIFTDLKGEVDNFNFFKSE